MRISTAPAYKKPALLEVEVDDNGKEFDSLINESSFRINLIPSPDVVKLFDDHNFSRHGQSTWSRHVNDENIGDVNGFFRQYTQHFTPQTLYSSKTKLSTMPFLGEILLNYLSRQRHIRSSQMYFKNSSGVINGADSVLFRQLYAASNHFMYWDVPSSEEYATKISNHTERSDLNPHYVENRSNYLTILEEMRNELSPGRFFVYMKNNRLWVKLYMDPAFLPSGDNYPKFSDVAREAVTEYIDGNINHPGASAKGSKFITRWDAEKVIDSINEHYLTSSSWDLESSESALSYLDKANSMVTVGYAPGQPTKAYVVAGKDSEKLKGVALQPGNSMDIAVSRIINAQQKNPNQEFAIHPSLIDIVNMNNAKDYKEDDRLHSYQKRAVGLHMSTNVGYLNASDPGLGKSVMQLSAMRERAQDIQNYRGLIACEANVRSQWKEYAQVWFPDAHVFVQNSSSQHSGLIEALSQEGPVIIVSSYALLSTVVDAKEMRAQQVENFKSMSIDQMKDFFSQQTEEEIVCGELLLDTHWHDVCADEAVCVRNGGSKQSQGMWILRRNSDVAVALTGTPVNKHADEMGKLLQWARNDDKLFQKHKLSETYDTETLKGSTELFNDLFPLVFRRERNEVRDEIESSGANQKIPDMVPPKSILLKPSPAEKSLAHAAEKELKRVYLELVSALEAVENESGSSQELKEAKEQLRNAHGQWLGGTQLARMATSDPASLMESESVGASLLVGQGLVANALDQEPTKRKEFIKRAHGHVKNKESILVFTDFSVVANSLVEALEENGIRAGAFTGKNLKAREQNRKKFQDGDLDVLVCTKAAERGLTLHKASAVYHYDMPWTIERLIQRMGRALRVGSENEKVKIYFMILEGTVEERVAQQVLSQGTTASMILDASRGIDVSKTGLGNTMKGLMSTSKSLASRKGALEFGKALNLSA